MYSEKGHEGGTLPLQTKFRKTATIYNNIISLEFCAPLYIGNTDTWPNSSISCEYLWIRDPLSSRNANQGHHGVAFLLRFITVSRSSLLRWFASPEAKVMYATVHAGRPSILHDSIPIQRFGWPTMVAQAQPRCIKEIRPSSVLYSLFYYSNRRCTGNV